MSDFRVAFSGGLRRAQRVWLIVPLYLFSLVLGLVQTWPLLLAGGDGLRNPFLVNLATGGSDAVLDLFLGSTAARIPAVIWGGVLLPLTLLFGLAYTFFSGGMLAMSSGSLPFWPGCRRFFWSFTGLGLVVLVVLTVLVGLSALAIPWIGTSVWLIIAVVLAQLVNLIGEYGRAVAVVRDRRNPFVLFGVGLVFCMRHIGGVVLLALLGLLLHAAVGALAFGLQTVPLGVGAVVAQQIIVLLWLWVKLLRLTWALSYVQAVAQVPRVPELDQSLAPVSF